MSRGRRCLLLASLLCAACGDGTTAGVDRAFLWRLDASSQPSYLLGTIHVGVDATELPPAVWQAFDRCSVFAAESDITEAVSPEQIDQAFALPGDVTLQQLLPGVIWDRLREVLPTAPEPELQRIHPWALQSGLQQALLPDHVSMDEAFTVRAGQDGKSVVFLETFAQFSAAMGDVPLQESADSLAAMLADPRGFVAAIQTLEQLYRTGDAGTVRAGLNWTAEGSEPSATDEQLLKRRNEAWLPALLELFRGGGAFVAVGLGHLIGPDNLLDMLAAHDLKAQRVGPKDARNVTSAATRHIPLFVRYAPIRGALAPL